MGVGGWMLLGLISGLIARAVVPGRQSLGLLATLLLGVGGSLVGGFLIALWRGHHWSRLHPTGVVGSILGAVVLLAVGQLLLGRRE